MIWTQQISPSRSCGGHYQAYFLHTTFQILLRQWLCHHIWLVLRYMYILNLQQLLLKHVSYPMIPHINMLGFRMVRRILCQVNDTLTVIVHNKYLSQYTINMSYFTPNSCRKFFIHKFSLQPSVIAIYSILVVDKATHCWSLDYQETAPLVKVSKYPDKDFLELTSPAMSPPKYKYALEVPLRYLRIHFPIVQCSLPRLERNRLITLTAWAISGLVQTVAYIKLPTAEA